MVEHQSEYDAHMAPAIADGYVLDPAEYVRLGSWAYVHYQLMVVELEIKWLRDNKPEKYDGTNWFQHYSRFCGAISAYGRCFVSTKGHGIVTLDQKEVFKLRSNLKQVHERLMDIRNGVVAHPGNDELFRVTIGVKEDGNRSIVRTMLTPVLPYQDFDKYLEVITHVSGWTLGGAARLKDHLEKKLNRTIEPYDVLKDTRTT